MRCGVSTPTGEETSDEVPPQVRRFSSLPMLPCLDLSSLPLRSARDAAGSGVVLLTSFDLCTGDSLKPRLD